MTYSRGDHLTCHVFRYGIPINCRKKHPYVSYTHAYVYNRKIIIMKEIKERTALTK